MSEQPQRPASDEDREVWRAHWAAHGVPWRTEPEIGEERQRYLAERRAVKPDIDNGIYPFRDENGGIKLSRADVEWLLATHEYGGELGPIDRSRVVVRDWAVASVIRLSSAFAKDPDYWVSSGDDSSASRQIGLDLRGASLQQSDLSYLPLTGTRFGLPAFSMLTALYRSIFSTEWADLAKRFVTILEQVVPEFREDAEEVAQSIEREIRSELGDQAWIVASSSQSNQATSGVARKRPSLTYFEAEVDEHLDEYGSGLLGVEEDEFLERLRLHKVGDKAVVAVQRMMRAFAHEFARRADEMIAARYDSAAAHVEGANLSGAHLEAACFSGGHLEGANLADAHCEGAEFFGAFAEGANLGFARLGWADLSRAQLAGASLAGARCEDAFLSQAQLAGADLSYARLDGAHLNAAHLGGCELSESDRERIAEWSESLPARLPPARLTRAHFDSLTDLTNVDFGDSRHRGPWLGDIGWNGANLTVTDWSGILQVGEAHDARKPKQDGQDGTLRKSRAVRLREYVTAARANRQLAQALRAQGLTEDADRFAYRAQVMQRVVYRRQRHYLRYTGSFLLALIAGYGYRPLRSFIAYAVVILAFAGLYLLNAQFAAPHLTWDESLVLSISSFHGRGFFSSGISLSDTLARLAAGEAIIGLLIEITFIATFTQRFFAR